MLCCADKAVHLAWSRLLATQTDGLLTEGGLHPSLTTLSAKWGSTRTRCSKNKFWTCPSFNRCFQARSSQLLIPVRSRLDPLDGNGKSYGYLRVILLRILGFFPNKKQLPSYNVKYSVRTVGSIPFTTEFFLISCNSNQVPKWFGYSSMGPLCGLRLGQNASLTLNNNKNLPVFRIEQWWRSWKTPCTVKR